MTLRPVTSARELAARRDRILTDAEARLEQAAGKALRQFLRRIVARLTPQALTAAAHDSPRTVHLFTLGEAAGWWDAAVDEHVAAAVRSTWRSGFSDASDLPVPGPASAGQADYLAAVKDRLSRTATPTIPDQAFDMARTALADELAHGRGIREASQRLAAEFGWDQPAEFWRGRLADLDAQVDAILDPIGPPGDEAREAARKTDPVVRGLQAQRAEAVKRIDRVQSTWQVRAERIARTECLPGGAPVTAARATVAYRRLYHGEWITVRLGSGRELSGTPNHPMLTTRGWVGLGELTEHDHVLYHRGQVQAAGAAVHEHVQTPPPTAREVFDALAAVGIVERKRTGQPDFHGDGMDGHVDVAYADSVLLVGDFAAVNERAVDGVLECADLRHVALDAFCAPFPRGGAVDQLPPLRRGTQPDSGLPEHAGDDSLGYVELALKALLRPSSLVLLGDVVGWQVRPQPWVPPAGVSGARGGSSAASLYSPLRERVVDLAGGEPGRVGYGRGAEPGEIALDEVVSVRVGHWSGHVYNLSTVDGYFNTGAYYTGNTTGAYNAGALEAGIVEEAGVKRWTATASSRTRDSHLAADGQCVPIRDAFTVGGSSMMMPGDPAAPIGERANCRCAVVFSRDCDEAAEEFSAVDDVMNAERERRAEEAAEAGKPSGAGENPPGGRVVDDEDVGWATGTDT